MSTIYDPDLGERVAHFVQQDDGRMITGMVMILDYIDEDGQQCTAISTAPEQKMTTTAGLVALSKAMSDHELTVWVKSQDDDEGGTA